MWRAQIRVCALTAALVMGASVGLAASDTASDPAHDCNEGVPAVAVGGCTVLIESGVLGPDDLVTALMNRAIAHAQLGHPGDAKGDLDKAIDLAPGDALLHYNRGNILFDAGSYEAAIADFDAAIASESTFALAYLNRGLAYKQLGKLDESARDLNRALELDPSLVSAKAELVHLEEMR